MPPKRGRKRGGGGARGRRNIPNAGPSNDTIEISDDEQLRMAIEESMKDAANASRITTISTEDEDEDLKRALELSMMDVQNNPPVPQEKSLIGQAFDAGVTAVNAMVNKVFKEPFAATSDEFDEMAAGPSTTLSSRINSDSIVIESGEDDTSVIETTRGNDEDSDEDDDSNGDSDDSEDGDFDISMDMTGGRRNFRRIRRNDSTPQGASAGAGPSADNLLTTAQKSERIRTMFQSGLDIHFSGTEMEGCRAIKTDLFPHQRVALAWMFKHENEEADGMLGGILADDMGLGKSLTVISLIFTNHWDGKPLCKPELGFRRQPFNPLEQKRTKGKGKTGGAFRPKLSAKELGVGSKLEVPKKKTIGGLFSKFNQSSSDSESEKENRGTFSFGEKSKKKKQSKVTDFINDESSDLESGSEDEFDKMSSKKNIFKSSKTIFKKEENPIDQNNLKDIEPEDDELSQEEIMKSMIPTSLDELENEMKPKLNVDGPFDASSSDEDFKPQRKKRKAPTVDSSEDESNVKPKGKSRARPAKKTRATTRKSVFQVDEDSDALPSPESVRNNEVADEASRSDSDNDDDRGERSKNRNNEFSVNSRVNAETGLKLIIPPKLPAERAGRRRATLLVCPTSLISHWTEQLDNHLHESVNIKLKIHHGQTKALTGADLETYDMVITTYGTLASEYGTSTHSPLLRARWLRVVLDEGHFIKNHNSKTAKAALNLDTIRRWIVTGTPIQNNLMEFWSLINWLNFGLYAGKGNMRYFKHDIVRPCKNGDPRGFERLQVLIDAVCLRRTKSDKRPDGSPIVSLPTKTVITREVEMMEEELVVYKHFLKNAQRIVARYQKRGTILKNYAHIFALMMRLRQLCCHRELIKEIDWNEALKDKENLLKMLDEMLGAEEREEEKGGDELDDQSKRLMKQLRDMIRDGVTEDCSICLDDLKSPVITPCGHVYCRACIEQVLKTCKPPACPLCRRTLKKSELLEAGQDDEEETDEITKKTEADMKDILVNLSSSKVNAALTEMARIKRDHPEDKIVVVSQFTSFLSIIQALLRDQGFSYVRLDGSMNHADRAEVVKVFQSTGKNSPKVLLLSLKAGGVGLNLTSANHLLLLDPAWNPASEWQCFDRVHRLGQTKNVFIYKYITKESIEGKMMEIQNKKKDLITGAFHMPEEERRRQRINDIRNIFGV